MFVEMVKRVVILIVGSLFLCLTMASCHTTEPPCPAYAYQQEESQDVN
jgi:hypothetical protein